MRPFFVLLLIVLMPLKVLAASFGICSQDLRSHGQQHSVQTVQSHSEHANHQQLSGNKHDNKHECAHCNLCHTACGTFVLTLNAGLFLTINMAQTVRMDQAIRVKAQPSDPPYRPKWSALA